MAVENVSCGSECGQGGVRSKWVCTHVAARPLAEGSHPQIEKQLICMFISPVVQKKIRAVAAVHFAQSDVHKHLKGHASAIPTHMHAIGGVVVYFQNQRNEYALLVHVKI